MLAPDGGRESTLRLAARALARECPPLQDLIHLRVLKFMREVGLLKK